MARVRLRFSIARWRTFIVGLVAVLACLGVGSLLMLRPESAEVAALRERAKVNGLKAKMWAQYAELSDKGVTSLGAGQLDDYTPGEILSFNHFIPRPRPTAPEQAEAFDRECAAIAAKCRMMQAYYDRLRIKWERAAYHRSGALPPDPPPPLSIEPSHIQDITF